MADIYKNEATVVRTVRPDPRDVLEVPAGVVVTNVGARTVQYDEAPDFASATSRTTGQAVTTSVRTFFRVTAGQGKVAISVPEKSDDASQEARLDTAETQIAALVAAPAALTSDSGITPATDLRNDANAAAIVAFIQTVVAQLAAKGILVHTETAD